MKGKSKSNLRPRGGDGVVVVPTRRKDKSRVTGSAPVVSTLSNGFWLYLRILESLRGNNAPIYSNVIDGISTITDVKNFSDYEPHDAKGWVILYISSNIREALDSRSFKLGSNSVRYEIYHTRGP